MITSNHPLGKISFLCDDIEDLDEGTEKYFLSHLTYCTVLKKNNGKYLFMSKFSFFKEFYCWYCYRRSLFSPFSPLPPSPTLLPRPSQRCCLCPCQIPFTLNNFIKV